MAAKKARQLLDIAIEGDKAAVKKMLGEKGASAKRPKNLLHRVIFSGWHQGEDMGVLELLLDAGASVDSREDGGGGSPLHEAARVGPFPSRSLAVTDLLLRRGADVNAKDRFGRTPLHLAVTTIASGTVERLIEAGADVNAVAENGSTPIHECVGSFYEHFDPDDEDDGGPEMAEDYVAAALAPLLEAGVDVDARNEQGETPLSAVMRRPRYPERIVAMLADAGASLTEVVHATEDEDLSPLGIAVLFDYSPTLIAKMIEAGNDPKQTFGFFRDASVIAAASSNRPLAARAIFDARPDLLTWRTEKKQATMLHCAVISDDADLVRYLLDGGVDPSATNVEGKTALDVAEERNCAVAAEVLRSLSGD